MRTRREREVEQLARGHAASNGWNQDSHQAMCLQNLGSNHRVIQVSLLKLVSSTCIQMSYWNRNFLSLAPLCLTEITCYVPQCAEASIPLKHAVDEVTSMPLHLLPPPSPSDSTRRVVSTFRSISSRKAGHQYVASVRSYAALQWWSIRHCMYARLLWRDCKVLKGRGCVFAFSVSSTL